MQFTMIEVCFVGGGHGDLFLVAEKPFELANYLGRDLKLLTLLESHDLTPPVFY